MGADPRGRRRKHNGLREKIAEMLTDDILVTRDIPAGSIDAIISREFNDETHEFRTIGGYEGKRYIIRIK